MRVRARRRLPGGSRTWTGVALIYSLDTNVCIALMRRVDEGVAAAYSRAVLEERPVVLSAVVLFKLEYGVAQSRDVQQNRERWRGF